MPSLSTVIPVVLPAPAVEALRRSERVRHTRTVARHARTEIARADGHGYTLAVTTRIALVATGIIGIAAGATGLVISGVGAGSIDTLLAAVAIHTGIAHGTLGVIFGAVLLAVAWVLGRPPGVATIAVVAGVGPLMNIALAHTPRPTDQATGWAVLAAGIILCAIGVAALIHANWGTGSMELFVAGIADLSNTSQVAIRVLTETAVVIAAVAAGGKFGWGTAVCAATIGPAVGVATWVLRRALRPFTDPEREPRTVALRFTRGL